MTIDQCIADLRLQFNVIDAINCDDYTKSIEELYSRIKKLHKESYNSNDRLIFSITSDAYKENSSCGIMLQSLQNILNDVDISNFFVCIVTTNSDIQSEYNWILDNSSTDKVSVHLYQCIGNYNKLAFAGQSSYIKYQKIDNIDLLDSLSDEHKDFLFYNDSFCLMPWVGIMIDTNSKIKPCCMSTEILGDCSKNSLKEIWNSNTTKQLRKDMLANKKPNSCQSCYDREILGRDTLRKSTNRRYAKYIKKISTTDNSGFLKDFSLNYLDSRFNNLCNLSCRSCGPNASSSWHRPAVAIGRIDKSVKALRIAGKNNFDIYNQILEHVDTLECIYFAGGEPLMIDQFYQIVEELDRYGRHDVELVYNINMTKSSLGGKSIFDVWKNFKKISIGASLDGEYQRGEYLRTGQKWNDVLEFRKEMLTKRPDIDFYISATTSIINALHLPDFHRSWAEQGLINPSDFDINILFYPDYLRVDSAPEYLKNLIREKYHKHLEWLRPIDPVGRATFGFESIINYLKNNRQFNGVEFWNNITPLDEYYGQHLIDFFPELADLPKH